MNAAQLEGAVGRVEQQLGSLLAHPLIAAVLNDTAANLVGDETVTTPKIADLAITNAKIADATIESAKISNLAVDKLLAGDIEVELNLAVGGAITVGGEARMTADGLQFATPDGGADFYGTVPDEVRFRWLREDFDGLDVADVGGGFNVDGGFEINRAFMRSYLPGNANTDFGYAEIGIWNPDDDDYSGFMRLLTRGDETAMTRWFLARRDGEAAWMSLAEIAADQWQLYVGGYEVGTCWGSADVTIASGAVTVPAVGLVSVDTESAAASDDLDTINGGRIGQSIIIKAANSGRTVNVTEAGNIELSSSPCALDNAEDTITLVYTSFSIWLETARSNNGA